MRLYEPRMPVGLDEFTRAAQEICSDARMYRFSGIRPDPILLKMDSGQGRTCAARYITDLFHMHGVLDFASSREDCLEFVLDGTLPQMRSVLEEIRAAAEYDNVYREVTAIDISALADHLNETQTAEFLDRVRTLCQDAFVIFFVHRETGVREDRLIERLYERVPQLQMIETDLYTADELAEITARILEEKGIVIEDRENVVSSIRTLLNEGTMDMTEARAAAARLLRRCDYTGVRASIDEAAVRAEYQMKKGGH